MKIKIFIALISILLLNFSAQSQSDEDINRLSLNDTVSVEETLRNLSAQVELDPVSSIPLLQLLYEKISKYPFSPFKELKWKYAINRSLMIAFEKIDQLDEAILYGDRAIKNAEKLRLYSDAQGLRVNTGDMYYRLGERLKSLNRFYQALNNWDGELPMAYEPMAYFGIARVHFEQRNYQDAEKSLNEALKRSPDVALKADILSYLGATKFETDDFLHALEYFSKSLSINEKLRNQHKLGQNYQSIGKVFYSLGNSDKAENFFLLSLKEDREVENHEEMASTYAVLMDLKLNQNKRDKALEYGKLALKYGGKSGNLDLKENIFLGLSEIYQERGETEKSLSFYKKYSEVLNQKIDKRHSEEINEFRVKYEMEKKERELEELNNQKRLSELAFQQKIADDRKEKNMLFAFGTLMFVIILMGAVLLFNYQRQIEANKTINLKTEEINRVKIKELEKSLRLESANAMLKGQEIERNRIAKDLHDSVGALLSSIKLHFETIKGHISNTKGSQVYEKTNQLIDEACFEVRNISHDMMPGSLIRFGLIPALQDYTSKLKSDKKLAVDIINYGIPEKLDDSVSLNAYRIVQELLNNVIKHSGAREVLVQLTVKGNQLNIMVEDDGQGFDPELAKEKGMGLKNIISRVNYLNGEIHFDSEEGKGSNIMIDFPIAS